MLKDNNLAKNKYRFCQEIEIYPSKDKRLAKKKYRFCQEIEIYPSRDKRLAKKKYKFCQEEIKIELISDKSLAQKKRFC